MTYGEIVYMCLDEIKAMSDDAYVTEDHIVFLISKYRSYLLAQKYGKTNLPVDYSNFQTIEVMTDGSPSQPLFIMGIAKPIIVNYTYAGVDRVENEFYYVTYNRFKYVGINNYLKASNSKHVGYATIDPEGRLRIQKDVAKLSSNFEVTAVFEDITSFNGMETRCPIEEELVAGVMELVVKDVLGIAYRPEDKINNGSDDLSTVGMATKNSK